MFRRWQIEIPNCSRRRLTSSGHRDTKRCDWLFEVLDEALYSVDTTLQIERMVRRDSLPKDIDRLRIRRFFDHVWFDMIKIILVDIDGIVLSDGVLHRLEANAAMRHRLCSRHTCPRERMVLA